MLGGPSALPWPPDSETPIILVDDRRTSRGVPVRDVPDDRIAGLDLLGSSSTVARTVARGDIERQCGRRASSVGPEGGRCVGFLGCREWECKRTFGARVNGYRNRILAEPRLLPVSWA